MSTLELNKILQNSQETLDDQKKNEKCIQLIVFKLGGEEYSLPIDQIKEVVITPSISSVPRTPDYIKGVANIRGNVIAILDLEEKFDLNRSESNLVENGFNYTLVIENEEHKVGILVNEVPNTLNIYESAIDTSMNVLQYSALDENCIAGIVKTDSKMIILIDIVNMIQNDLMNEVN